MTHTIKAIFVWLAASGGLLAIYTWLLRILRRATDVDCGYNWGFDGTLDSPRNMRPQLDLRNCSRSRTYRLASISYEGRGLQRWCDNDSLWGQELKPGSIEYYNRIAPVPRVATLQDCLDLAVKLRFQDNHEIVCHGPGQPESKWRHRAMRLRRWLDKVSITPES